MKHPATPINNSLFPIFQSYKLTSHLTCLPHSMSNEFILKTCLQTWISTDLLIKNCFAQMEWIVPATPRSSSLITAARFNSVAKKVSTSFIPDWRGKKTYFYTISFGKIHLGFRALNCPQTTSTACNRKFSERFRRLFFLSSPKTVPEINKWASTINRQLN